ncbi:hypothetical protein KXR87_08440 [Yokenella regensburgei]|uniref:hypothetical protein n=1 Tax=Yokenella regensburgei TaxID=158877 RepID=UPI003F17C003
MRITVLEDDPGERIIPGRESITVYLDGVEVKTCLTADDVKGEVVYVERDYRGHIVAVNGEVQHRIRYGEVKIERLPR